MTTTMPASLHIFLCELRLQGVEFVTDGVKTLRAKAPKGIIDDSLRRFLSDNKPRIITALSNARIIREFFSATMDEVCELNLRVPTEFSDQLEVKAIEFIDGSIPLDHLREMWTRFVEQQSGEVRQQVEEEIL